MDIALQELIATAFRVIPAGAAIVNRKGEVVYGNVAFYSIVGYEVGALNSQHVDALLAESDRAGHADNVSAYFNNPLTRHLMARRRLVNILTADTKLTEVEVFVNPINTDYAVVTITEVTPHKKSNVAKAIQILGDALEDFSID